MFPDHALLERIWTLAARTEGLHLLLLFGSRARGDGSAQSDWDFAYRADDTFAPGDFLATLVELLTIDCIDLVDLDRAGGQLRYRAAADGRLLFEREPKAFERFWLEAVSFWCDAEPVIRRGYDEVLRGLTP